MLSGIGLADELTANGLPIEKAANIVNETRIPEAP
jgi:hypothetical protein